MAPPPRAFWSGTLTFGLVSVPVDLYPAVRSRRIGLRMLGPEDQPLVRRYFCSADGAALGPDDIVRGYENDDGSFTIVTDEELDALAPRKSRDIDLRRFVQRHLFGRAGSTSSEQPCARGGIAAGVCTLCYVNLIEEGSVRGLLSLCQGARILAETTA